MVKILGLGPGGGEGLFKQREKIVREWKRKRSECMQVFVKLS